jgi:hypothetical protein
LGSDRDLRERRWLSPEAAVTGLRQIRRWQ